MKIGLSLFAVAAAALLAVGCGGDKGGGEDEAAQVELDKKKSEAGFVSLEDMFQTPIVML